jgi:hypothetical protein
MSEKYLLKDACWSVFGRDCDIHAQVVRAQV